MVISGIPPHTHPPTPPDTMGRWQRRLHPVLYLVFILIILIMVAIVMGQIVWIEVLMVIIFFIVCFGIVWSWTHSKED